MQTYSHFPWLCFPFSLSTKSNWLYFFDFSNALDILPRALLLHKLNNYGLHSAYINWFLSYLTNRQSCVSISVMLSLSFVVLSGVLKRSVLGSLLFNIFNNWCNVNNPSVVFLLMRLKSVDQLIHPVTVQFYSQILIVYTMFGKFYVPNLVKLYLFFLMKMKVLNYRYRFENSYVLRTDFIKRLNVDIDCKIHLLIFFSHIQWNY